MNTKTTSYEETKVFTYSIEKMRETFTRAFNKIKNDNGLDQNMLNIILKDVITNDHNTTNKHIDILSGMINEKFHDKDHNLLFDTLSSYNLFLMYLKSNEGIKNDNVISNIKSITDFMKTIKKLSI